MRRSLLLVLLCLGWGGVVAFASATKAYAVSPGRFSVGVSGGLLLPDADLADYRWDRTPTSTWGIEGMAGLGNWEAGLRLRGWRTNQETGIPGTSASPDVRLWSPELVAGRKLVALGGTELWGRAHVGRVFVSYDPDELTLTLPDDTEPLTVRFSDVDDWGFGGEVSLRKTLGEVWDVSGGLEHRVFMLNTVHRAGEAVEEERRAFGQWTFTLRLTRILWS